MRQLAKKDTQFIHKRKYEVGLPYHLINVVSPL